MSDIIRNVAKDLARIGGFMIGLAMIAADYKYPWWGEMILAAIGLNLMVNCAVRLCPTGMWPFNDANGGSDK